MEPSGEELRTLRSLADVEQWVEAEWPHRYFRRSLYFMLGGLRLTRQVAAIPSALFESKVGELQVAQVAAEGSQEQLTAATPIEVGMALTLRRGGWRWGHGCGDKGGVEEVQVVECVGPDGRFGGRVAGDEQAARTHQGVETCSQRQRGPRVSCGGEWGATLSDVSEAGCGAYAMGRLCCVAASLHAVRQEATLCYLLSGIRGSWVPKKVPGP
eukprot:1880024-Amphidinium_carterae.2